jgi:hypothetical protein
VTPAVGGNGTPGAGPPPGPPVVVLQIVRNEQTGQVTVHGPLHDAVLCYGLLVAAQTVVTAYQEQQRRGGSGLVAAARMPA